ncbi:hypothetical protein IGI04_029570 [Brassica rapa subsp. trilocularis]|uniref:Enoyl reductase (ER) domain-containing protein n=1 Tax=Brassica rapa subsp. trilocularis TaxID=1813537 RepID=A0ABQ7LNB7_BRACM|nr:hypothetical protein IGI04_029570 [Brassica rapa subsp. trilocularis]
MEIKPGLSALVTGGASGIGRALCLALAEKGVFVTVVDFSEEKGKETTSLVQKANAPFHPGLNSPSAIFVKCDVTNRGDLIAAFDKHLATFGTLDICINNAGIANPARFDKDDSDGSRSWRHTINVDLVAVVESTQLAIKAMKGKQKPGVIINMGSAAGLYPMSFDPIYSAAKGGVVLFTRSLAHLKRQGVRINVLCPEFIQTDLAEAIGASFLQAIGGYMPMDMLIKGAFELITDESKAGACLWISNRRGLEYWPTPMEQAKYLVGSSSRKKTSFKVTSTIELPQSFEKIIVHALSHNFRNATCIVRTPLQLPIGPHQVLLKIIYAGVNASDVNFSSGRYFSGGSPKLPFDAGFEGVGLIAAVGESVKNLEVGTPAAVMTFGAYAEYMIVSAKHVLPVPRPDPEVVAMLTSGLTALTALEKAGQMKSDETVLVTAAAGGTGQFAVQLAKLAGNKVIATCGGSEKAKLLKELGVDRVIDYKAEDIKTVLKKEFPKGVDIIYESVGGKMFDLCLNALAVYGRLIVIGMISQYQGEKGWQPANYPGLCEKILAKSQTVAGFFLVQYSQLWKQNLDKLFNLYSLGKLKVVVCMDPTFEQTTSRLKIITGEDILRRIALSYPLRSHPLFIRHFPRYYQPLSPSQTAVILSGSHYLCRLSTTTLRCISSQTSSDLVSEHPPFVRIYKDGRVERLAGTETIPASLTRQNGVVSKDVVYSPEHNLSVRLFLPHKSTELVTGNNNKLPLLIYIHGGAWLIGSPFSPIYHNFLTEVVKTANCLAVSVQYRLAPEYPIPAAYEDSWSAIQWIISHSNESGPSFPRRRQRRRGGNMAHHMAVRAGKEKLNARIKGTAIVHPAFWGKEPIDELDVQDGEARRRVAEVWEKLVSPGSVDGADDPWFNVVGSGSDFLGLGCEKVLVAVAGRDVFVRQGLGYAEKLKKSGWRGDVEVMEEEDEDHCFHLLNPCSENAPRFMTKFVEFITG